MDKLGPRIAAIAEGLGREEPIRRVARETASVAVMIGPGEEILLIRRADREGDPWSGDIALPGGRVEAGDASFSAAAAREAREEVGVDLDADARFLGYMAPFQARRRGIWVVPSVFVITGDVSVQRNGEASSHMWVPLGELLARGNRSTHRLELGGEERSFPSFDLQGYVVWGLTERILSSLVESIEKKKNNNNESI